MLLLWRAGVKCLVCVQGVRCACWFGLVYCWTSLLLVLGVLGLCLLVVSAIAACMVQLVWLVAGEA